MQTERTWTNQSLFYTASELSTLAKRKWPGGLREAIKSAARPFRDGEARARCWPLVPCPCPLILCPCPFHPSPSSFVLRLWLSASSYPSFILPWDCAVRRGGAPGPLFFIFRFVHGSPLYWPAKGSKNLRGQTHVSDSGNRLPRGCRLLFANYFVFCWFVHFR